MGIQKTGKRGIHTLLFLYWFVLVLWQNIGGGTGRTGMDLAIKIGLLIVLTWGFLSCGRYETKNFYLILCYILFMVTAFINEHVYSSDVLISYAFPILFIFLIFGIGDSLEVNCAQLLFFYNAVILVSVYSAIYSILFYTNQFTTAFSIDNAYGNELKSFFVSPHEYGLYMSASVISCMACIEIKKGNRFRNKWYYYAALLILIPNLILTYSRTSYLGTVCFAFAFILFGKSSSMRKLVFLATILGVVIYLSSATVRRFVFQIMMKEYNPAGRVELTNWALDYYHRGSVWNKLFGYGVTQIKVSMSGLSSYGVHNAYLQVLLNYGLFGLLWLIAFLIVCMRKAYRQIKNYGRWGVFHLGLILWASSIMITNTNVVFTSPIDSYFLTVFSIVIPKYVGNALNNNSFLGKKDV